MRKIERIFVHCTASLLCLAAYIAVMQVTKSRWAWLAAELTGMGMVYAVCVYKLMV